MTVDPWLLRFHPEAAADAPPPHPILSEPASFAGVLAELQALHDRKNRDYGRDADPYANCRASEDFGIAGWVGTLIRANDKMRRLQRAAAGATLANEGVEDSLLDLAVYSVIALILYREAHGTRRP